MSNATDVHVPTWLKRDFFERACPHDVRVELARTADALEQIARQLADLEVPALIRRADQALDAALAEDRELSENESLATTLARLSGYERLRELRLLVSVLADVDSSPSGWYATELLEKYAHLLGARATNVTPEADGHVVG